MDKTIKINLGGTLFHIDQEAYTILRRYLKDIDDRLKSTPGGAETIEDIESRIAEIFQSQGAAAGVISKENVEAMISIIGKPEDFETTGEEGQQKEAYYHSATRKKMYRNPYDMIVSGVCGGIGAYLGIEPVWIRLIFILFTCFFGIGLFVYVALWIALPSAHTDTQKRDMYGSSNINSSSRKGTTSYSLSASNSDYAKSGPADSGVGNAFNEVFRAIGKVCYVILRIFLIIVGVSFVLTGFIALVSFVMVFFFKYPGYFSTHSFGINIFYLPDFLNYVVNPAVAPWILALSFIVILIPLLALIYWGIKMIFWFKAKDGIFTLVGLVIWVMSVAALSIILFNEGVSYAETGKTVLQEVVAKAPADLYILSDHKVADLHYDKEISVPDENYDIYFINDNKGLFISTRLNINNSEDNSLRIDVRKRSTGRSKVDATNKAESLSYYYRMSGDTLYLDEYFSIPSDTKWSIDNVGVNLFIPEGTLVHFDQTTENMFRAHHHNDEEWGWDHNSEEREYVSSGNGKYLWVMTQEGLRRKSELPEKEK
jgi:phage shock protein PspC (stress-responsive transcriptional regulator)